MEEKKQLKDALKEKEQAAAQENTENENLDEYGDIRIADEVICIVASLAAQGKLVNASVYINVEYGACIPEIALEVQEKVKDAIEAMTGYEVQFVDVNVEGVAKRPQTELEKAASSDEDMAEILQAQQKSAEATEENSFEQQLANLRDDDGFKLPDEEEMDEKHKRFFEED